VGHEGVARVLAFDGSKELAEANTVLKESVDRFPKRNVAVHSEIALRLPEVVDFKEIQKTGSQLYIQRHPPSESAAIALMKSLGGSSKKIHNSCQVLGNIDLFYYFDRISTVLIQTGRFKEGTDLLQRLLETGHRRKVAENVLSSIHTRLQKLAKSKV
jgi:hypothetical protein